MTRQGLALTRLWDPSRAPRPGPRPRLSLATLIDAGIKVAQRAGLSAMTMAKVATEAGCAKMALYRHVSDRNDLIAAMVDAAIGPPPAASGSRQERFTRLWDTLSEVYASDQWLLELPIDLDAVTPNNVAWIDAALGLFDGATVPPGQRLDTVLLMTEMIRYGARRRAARGPVSDLEQLLTATANASDGLSPERFPNLGRLAANDELVPSSGEHANQVRDLMLRWLTDQLDSES